jgi:hypothetical protein
VPLPTEWPGLAGEPDRVDVQVDVLEWVSRDLQSGVAGVTIQAGRGPQASNQGRPGQLRALEDQPGVWATGRDVLYVHAQVRDRVEVFYSVVTESLTGVAQRLRASAGFYQNADEQSATRVRLVADPAVAGTPGGGSEPGAGPERSSGRIGSAFPVGEF